jgi:hypothetical protein
MGDIGTRPTEKSMRLEDTIRNQRLASGKAPEMRNHFEAGGHHPDTERVRLPRRSPGAGISTMLAPSSTIMRERECVAFPWGWLTDEPLMPLRARW